MIGGDCLPIKVLVNVLVDVCYQRYHFIVYFDVFCSSFGLITVPLDDFVCCAPLDSWQTGGCQKVVIPRKWFNLV